MIKTFPYLEISGTHKAVGEAIGEMFRGKIQEVIEERKHFIRKYTEKLEQTNIYGRYAKKYFPDLVDELEGMANGAQIPYQDLLFHNTPEVYDHTLDWDREQAQIEDKCTTVVSFSDSGALIGHNEDWDISALGELYVLKATIGDTTFLGLNYASFIPGNAASINSFGLVQCINELFQAGTIGVGKYFLSRAILDAKTLDEAETIIRQTKRGSGYNHVLYQDKELRDIEISGHDMDILKRKKEPYAHTNHFLSRHMQKYENATPVSHEGSFKRLKRAKELLKNNMSIKDMAELLSDTNDPLFSISREKTIASVIIDPATLTMHICYGQPIHGTYIPYKI